ncbi:ATP-binding cassette domain-containing protein [Acetobacteraceae bacterium]|nr:ATP-binding cassette domain-containing protein [Acetobacteraceae bacterium]
MSSLKRAPSLRIRGLRKSFGGREVLKGVDLDVPSGTSMVIIGGSGTGKSVLLRCLLGLEEPDAGSIEIDGVDVLSCRPSLAEALRAEIGMLFQNSALFDSISILENIIFALKALPRMQFLREKARYEIRGGEKPKFTKNPSHQELVSRASDLLHRVGLKVHQVGDLYPASASGGMQRRIGIARAMALKPGILLLDEPTAGLDPVMVAVIDALIKEAGGDKRTTSLTITHDMISACRVGNRAAMLYEGQIIWNGPIDQLMSSGNPVVEQFTHGLLKGPIETNFVPPATAKRL